MMNLNRCDYEGRKKPPLGIMPCLFLDGSMTQTVRRAELLNAIRRYLREGRYVLPIWWLELYCYKLVPNGSIVKVVPHYGALTFYFDNKMVVTLVDADEDKAIKEAYPLYIEYELIQHMKSVKANF